MVTAIGAAVQDVKAGLVGSVPAHLRDAHYTGATKLGHGNRYRYAHDFPDGIVAQQYAPDPVHGREYYHPTLYGAEGRASEVVDRTRAVLRGEEND